MSRVLDTVIWYVVTFGDGPVVMCMYQIRSPTDFYAGGAIPADALPIVTAGAASLAVSGLANATEYSVVWSHSIRTLLLDADGCRHHSRRWYALLADLTREPYPPMQLVFRVRCARNQSARCNTYC